MQIALNRPDLPATISGLEPLTVTVRDFVRLTGISQSRAYELMGAGELAFTHAAGRRLIYFSSIKKLVGIEGASSAAG